jgi:hypothetical protein
MATSSTSIFDAHNGTSKGAHLGTIRFPTGTSTLIMDDILAGAVYTNSGRADPVPSGDSMPVHQFTDKRTGTAKRLPLGISYVTDFATYDAQLMQDFHAGHVHTGRAGAAAGCPFCPCCRSRFLLGPCSNWPPQVVRHSRRRA